MRTEPSSTRSGSTSRVDKPADGFSEQENYSLAPEAFHLPPIAFTDAERAALQTALTLLDGEFAYAEPLRLALQQITWGRPSPLGSDSRQTIGLGITASAGGGEVSARGWRRSTPRSTAASGSSSSTTRWSRDETSPRMVDPYHLLFEGGQFYLVGYSHERKDVRVFRLSRIRGKVAYATKAEHDFQRPEDFDPRGFANRIPWQLGDAVGRRRGRDPRGPRRGTSSASSATYGTLDGQRLPHAVRAAAAADLVGAELRAADPRAAGAGRRGPRARRRI